MLDVFLKLLVKNKHVKINEVFDLACNYKENVTCQLVLHEYYVVLTSYERFQFSHNLAVKLITSVLEKSQAFKHIFVRHFYDFKFQLIRKSFVEDFILFILHGFFVYLDVSLHFFKHLLVHPVLNFSIH